MIIKIFPETEPRTILFLGTEDSLHDFLEKYTLQAGLSKDRLIIEEVPKENFKKELNNMREFTTSPIAQHGEIKL